MTETTREEPVFIAQPGAETEYRVIRDEILERIRMRQQLITGTLTLGGIFLGAGLALPQLALVYPPLAAFLALAWAQNDRRIRDLGGYIRDVVQPILTAARWELYMEERRHTADGPRVWRMVVLSHGGVFVYTQVTALFVGIAGYWDAFWSSRFPIQSVMGVLALVDVFAIGRTMIILLEAAGDEQKQEQSGKGGSGRWETLRLRPRLFP